MTDARQVAHVQRVGAYAVCVDDGRLLLARFADPDRRWTLPGGGVEHGEYPADAVVREVHEETGYDVEVRALLGIHTGIWYRPDTEVHATHLVYEVAVVGGTLRHETAGSSDQAAWFDVDDVPDLHQGTLLEIGLDLHRRRPSTGRPGVS